MSIPTIRTKVFDMKHELGFTGDDSLAKKIGMSQCNVFRIRHRQRIPHNQFIAGVLAAFPDKRFEDLFEVVME